MFEHLKMSKKLKQQLSKVLSIALSVAMLAGTIPADMLGGIASVKAANGSLSASDFTAEDTDATINAADDVFTVSSVTVKEDSSKYFEVTSSSSITFNIADGKKGTLNVTADDSTKLTLDGDALTGNSVPDIAKGDHTVSASATVKLTSISLTLADAGNNPDAGETANVSVTVTGENLLSEGDKITFTASGEDTEELTMTSGSIGGTVQLKKGTEYTIGCSNANVTATTKSGEDDTDKVTFIADGNLTINLAPKTSTVQPTVSITDSKNLLKDGDQLKLICAEENTTEAALNLNNGETVKLTVGSSYKIDPTSVPTGVTATLVGEDEDGIITATTGMTSLAVTVDAASVEKVTATITLDKETNAVLDDITYKISLVNKANDTDVIEIVDGTPSYQLAKNAIYEVISSVNTVKPTVHGAAAAAKTTVTTAEANLTVQIDLATKVGATVTFSGDTENLPATAAVKLTNKADAEDVVPLTNGGTANLWIGDEYTLSCTPATVTAKINNATSLTVTKATAIDVVITVTEGGGDEDDSNIVKTGTHILDMDVEFEGTANSTKFSVAADSTASTVTGLGTNDIENKTYTSADGYFKLHYKADGTRVDSGAKTFEGKTKTLNVNMQGTILDDNASIEFTVTEVPAKLKAYWRGGGSGTRDIYVLDSEKAEVPGLYDSMDGSDTQVTEFTIEEKGTYYLGCKSGGSRFFYVSVSQPAKFDMDVEFEGTANSTKFSVAADSTASTVTGLGTNDIENKTYTSADGYFKLHYKADGTRVDSGAKTFEGKTKTLNVNMQGTILDDNASIEFTVTEAPAKLKAYWRGGGSGTRDIYVLDSEKAEVPGLYDSMDGSDTQVTEFIIEEKGTYYLGCKSGGSRFFYVEVEEAYVPSDGPDRGDWENVAAPEITKVEVVGSTINVTAKGVVNSSGEGADSITIEMYNTELFEFGNPQPTSTQSSTANTTADADGNHLTTLTFTPSASGSYAFKAVLSREDQKDEDGNVIATYPSKESDYYEPYTTFKLPLATPEITTLMNIDGVYGDEEDEEGNKKLISGGITATWRGITEADYYILYAKEGTTTKSTKTEGTSAEVAGLTIDSTVAVSVIAYRNTGEAPEDISPESESKDIVITGERPHAYSFDAQDYLDVAPTDESGFQAAGTKYGTDDYFTGFKLASTPDKGFILRKNSAGSIAWMQLYQEGGAGVRFTVYGEADATFKVASTGGGNWSVFALQDSDGKFVEGTITGISTDTYAGTTDAGAYSTQNTDISTIDYKGLKAGTYTFSSPALASEKHEEHKRGGRIHSIAVYDNGDMPERGDWSSDNIGTPKISKIKYVKGEAKIKVTASGYIGYYGSDSLKVEMLDSKGDVVETIVKAEDSTFEGTNRTDADLEFEFTPKASDNYSFKASLVRSGEADIVMTDEVKDWTVKDFVLPLATPSVGTMTNMEDDKKADTDSDTDSAAKSGALEVIFSGVDEADYYVVAALSGTTLLDTEYIDVEAYEDKENAENPLKLASVKTEKEYTVTLKGLPIGDCYVTAQAFRKTDSKLNLAATTTTLTRVPATGEETKDTVDEKIEDTTDGSKATAPTADGFATAVARSKAFMPSASKYVNGKAATRWSHTVYGSNTSRGNYTRKKALNELDEEYPAKDSDGNLILDKNGNKTYKDENVPANGYYEEVYKQGDSLPEGTDIGDLKSVTVWSENGRGKVVPASTDGFSYYYTSINPSENNFTLSALLHVKSWTFSNGQDGFGLMVSDTVGKDGDDSDTWTNAYQLLASKIQYSWVRATGTVGEPDYVPGYVTNAPGNGTTIMRYEMKLGVGWNAKEGAKASDVAKIKAGTLTSPVNFSTSSGTLEHSAGDMDAFTDSYNVIGNAYGSAPTSSVANDKDLLKDLRFQIQKYDNAYALRYLAVNATELDLTEEQAEADRVTVGDDQYQKLNGKWYKLLGEQVFSDDNNNKLTQIDKNNIYVGFFAARNARIGVNDISLNVTKAGNDDYEIPTTYIDPSVTITSMEASNGKNYDLALNANFDGTLTIYQENGGKKTAVTTGKAITAGTKYTFTRTLNEGTTKFTYYAKPNENFVPGENQELSNFDMQTNEKEPFEVTYHAFDDDKIYVAPNGALIDTLKPDATGVKAGSAEYPTNVYDAVNYAKVGQTIILAGGTYDLTKDKYSNKDGAANLLIGKKHDGTPKSYITMRAATSEDGDFYNAAAGRPVLDFGQKTQKNDTAFIIAGNYWHFEGFDVMGSKDGQKGILLGGSHNILSDLRTYLNGNTGVQVARYSNYGRSEWPSYNTIINCSSFLNYDSGYEDADGFAAKLTCGDGNKFIGCIAAYNADDGWDLFAKVEDGSIGAVTIENCLAFKNGYLFGIKDYYTDTGADLVYRYTDFSKYTKNTSVLSAGNGNGFKMGGDSMSGYHVLRNSIAFGNKMKGIDSNSCPDIQVYNSISFNNESNNVALYTNAAVNTDYYVENLISIKDSSCANSGVTTAENIKMKGTQNSNKIYSSSNYYWDGAKSANADGTVFDMGRIGNMSVNSAIFGAKGTRIDRNPDGSINLHDFLAIDGESNIGNSDPDATLDKGADIYVFAADYSKGNSKLSDIKDLKKYDATLDGYNWVDGDILISSFAGTAVDFKVINADKRERSVTVNFIQLDGAELQVISGDNGDGVLDADEKWTVEAVPVISPAVEPNVALSGFSAEIKDAPKDMITLGTPAVGTVNANLKVAGASVTVEGKGKNGSAKLTATLSLTAGGKTVKKNAVLAFTVKDKVGIKFDNIDPDPTTASDKVSWTPDSDYIQVAMETMKDQTFTMKNLHFTDRDKDGNEITKDFGKGVTIKVNDTSVIKLDGKPKATADGKGVDVSFKVVNKSGDGGTATVTVTSKNDKSLVRNYIVTVSGSKFAWNSSLVTIDKAQTAGIQLAALEPFGTSGEVKNVTVKDVYKGTKASGKTYSDYNKFFAADYVTAGVYELNTTDKAVGKGTLPNGTYTLVYQAEVDVPDAGPTEGGQPEASQTEEAAATTKTVSVQFTPITIKVIETRPTVAFRQTKKVNLFYKNGTDGSTGKLNATSRQGAVTVTASANDYFRISDNGAGYDIVSISKDPKLVELKPSGAPDIKVARQHCKVTLKAHVEGYYDYYDIERKNFSIALEYRQPKLKLTALDNTIYTAVGMDGADILIYDPDSEMYLSPDVATIELVTDKSARKAYAKANEDFTVGDIANSANSGNGVRLIAKSNSVKGGAVRLSIKYDDWFSKDSVIVNQSIRVVKTTPRSTIKPVRLNINTEKFVGKEQASAAIIVTGAKGYTIDDFTLKGSNAKADEFLKFVDYELSTDINGDQVLLVSLKDEADDGTKFPATKNDKNGIYSMNRGYSSSYSFKAEYKLGTLSQKTNFRISLVKNEKLTVAVKGSINIIDRENSTVTLKPRMTNFTPSQVASVELTGDAANLFTIAEFDKSTGAMTVKAKDTAVLKKGSYKVTPVYYFDLGVSGTAMMQTDRPVMIKTAQSNLKISGLKDVLEVKLSSPDTAAQRTITVAPAGAYITDLTQTSGLENFKLTYTGDGIEVTITNRAGLKEGKTYRITALINVEGSGSNVKKQQISIPVKVFR